MLTLLKLQNVGGEKEDLARPQYRCIEDDSNDGCGNMLNTDFALFYEYNVLNNRRLADCDFTASQLTCDKADTFETAQEYAEVYHLNYYLSFDVCAVSVCLRLSASVCVCLRLRTF